MDNRTHDIILFGATGFTGKLIAQYLANHADREHISWAISGRNRTKLESLSAELPGKAPDILIADVHDQESLEMAASQCKILMNAAGPFNWYGKNVVSACINNSTHYMDITGEPSFVADVYNTFFDSAVANRSCIVNCCGFDSIPADYVAWLTAKKLPLTEPKLLQTYVETNAMFSGGTLTTAIQALHMEVQGISIKNKIKRHPKAPKLKLKIHKNKTMNAWAIPMPVVDPHIVKRSTARMPEEYGEATTYGQFFVQSSFLKMCGTILPIAVAMTLVRFKFFRDQMFKKYQPGTGPSEERRATSYFKVVCLGKAGDTYAQTSMSGGDPGYNETAKIFSQAAFTLLDHIKSHTIAYGVLTPVEALGMPLAGRLQKEGIHIQ